MQIVLLFDVLVELDARCENKPKVMQALDWTDDGTCLVGSAQRFDLFRREQVLSRKRCHEEHATTPYSSTPVGVYASLEYYSTSTKFMYCTTW